MSAKTRKFADIVRTYGTEAYHLDRSEEHTSELQSLTNLVCRLLLEKKKKKIELPILTNIVCSLLHALDIRHLIWLLNRINRTCQEILFHRGMRSIVTVVSVESLQ